jgi:hypothetical protein
MITICLTSHLGQETAKKYSLHQAEAVCLQKYNFINFPQKHSNSQRKIKHRFTKKGTDGLNLKP